MHNRSSKSSKVTFNEAYFKKSHEIIEETSQELKEDGEAASESDKVESPLESTPKETVSDKEHVEKVIGDSNEGEPSQATPSEATPSAGPEDSTAAEESEVGTSLARPESDISQSQGEDESFGTPQDSQTIPEVTEHEEDNNQSRKSKVVFQDNQEFKKRAEKKTPKKKKSRSPKKQRKVESVPTKSSLKASIRHSPARHLGLKVSSTHSAVGEEEGEFDVAEDVEVRVRLRTSLISSATSGPSIRDTGDSVVVLESQDKIIRRKKKQSKTAKSKTSMYSTLSADSESSSFSSDENFKKKSSKKHLRKMDSKKKLKAAQSSQSEEDVEVVQKVVAPSVTSVIDEQEPPKQKPAKKQAKKAPKKIGKAKKGKKVEKVQKTDAQLEEEAKVKAEEERQKFLAEKRAAIAEEKRELLEDSMRGEQLDITVEAMEACSEALENVTQAEQDAEEWRQYLVCDGLPAPWDVPGMNTYIHLWEKEVYTVSSERSKERTTEAINLLNQLEDILDDPFDHSERRNADWAWVASRFREFQELNLEYCTYRLLRDIKGKLNRIDIPTADFRMAEKLFSMCLWVSITLPTPAPNPRTQPKMRIQLEWPEMKVDIMFPNSLKREMVAIRGMYTKYDHLTDTSSNYRVGELPAYYKKSLADACREELHTKMKYKYDNRVIHKKEPIEVIQEDGNVVLEEPMPDPELDPSEMPPTVPFQKLETSPSTFFQHGIESEMYDALRSLAKDDLPSWVLNLRKYTVIGGVYYLDLFHQPPQPQGMVSYEVFISTLTEPYSLQKAPFIVEYEPPPAHEPGTRRTPEEIEEELQQQEKELDELIFVQITLPTHVYWLEPPVVVQWNSEDQVWATNTIFDYKNIEEKGYVTFRSGIFRPIAIATLRWSNMPYQAWEIRPEADGTVSFQLSCAILTIEFHVVKNTICVRDIQSAPNEAFDEHLNVYYRFAKLRKIMKSIGIDVFPYYDTFLYVEGTCEKYWPMENHLYFCMAYLSVLYNITWSRWNMTLDYQTIVFQMRPYRFDRPKQPNFDTVSVNSQRTVYIDCTEVSPEFSESPVEGMRFFADLWHLVRSTSTKAMRTRITDTDKTMVKTLYRLYKNVRFLSYS